MSDFRGVIEWLRWPLGFLFVYAAAFVREDEEGAIQNRLEEWWIRLMYARERSLSRTARFLSGVAQLIGSALTHLGDWGWRELSFGSL
jgi:hypothetical protein